jgi:hypothetical protein
MQDETAIADIKAFMDVVGQYPQAFLNHLATLSAP